MAYEIMGERVSNVLCVKILDLGLAKFRSREGQAIATMTAEGFAMGTLGYMSPEQLLGRDVDERADLFAIGVMLIEALTGEAPYRRELFPQIQPPVFFLPGDSPQNRALHDLLQRCVAANPAERTPSATALQSMLIPLLRAAGH